MGRTGTGLAGLALFLAGAAAGLAADRLLLARPAGEAAAPAAAPNAPRTPAPTDVQRFGDWTVHCIPGARPPCEMVLVTRNKEGRRISSVAIAYLPRLDRHALQIGMPLGVSLSGGVRINASKFTSQPMPYQRCDNAGCIVQGNIDKGALDTLGASDPGATLTATTMDSRAVSLPLSLRGFAEARAAMEKLAQQKFAAAPR